MVLILALCGVRRRACRVGNETDGGGEGEKCLMQRLVCSVCRKADAAAAYRAADLCIGRAEVAMFVVRQGLIRSLICQRMCNAMRKTAHLCEQQGGDQQ